MNKTQTKFVYQIFYKKGDNHHFYPLKFDTAEKAKKVAKDMKFEYFEIFQVPESNFGKLL